ncbi:hypothetical protein NADRNF5_1445 [Nitrosopumilus adriaticus]|uniref:Uncharacterized protein n=1 Tax=Nitrosopumilus adriaticus TaxID=1580092 RepID=A0A0D5C3I9_9ARCH|nr:hypothetical protein NADRNF5_1445 [Nitrosopumilus adriaticus]
MTKNIYESTKAIQSMIQTLSNRHVQNNDLSDTSSDKIISNNDCCMNLVHRDEMI